MSLQIPQKGVDGVAQRCPERVGVWLEDRPLGAAIQTFLNVERQTTHGYVLVIIFELVRAAQCARAPDHGADYGEVAQAVNAERVADKHDRYIGLSFFPPQKACNVIVDRARIQCINHRSPADESPAICAPVE